MGTKERTFIRRTRGETWARLIVALVLLSLGVILATTGSEMLVAAIAAITFGMIGLAMTQLTHWFGWPKPSGSDWVMEEFEKMCQGMDAGDVGIVRARLSTVAMIVKFHSLDLPPHMETRIAEARDFIQLTRHL